MISPGCVNNVRIVSKAIEMYNIMGLHTLRPANEASVLRNVKKKTLFSNQIRYESSIAAPSFLVSFWESVSNSAPVAYVQNGLIEIHDFTGLPWWASIILSTFLFRTAVTLPLTVYQNKITARLENVSLEMKSIAEELKKEATVAKKKFNWSNEHTVVVFQRSLKKQWDSRIIRDNCHPAKTFIVLWGQIPLWICQSVALRNLVNMLPNPNILEARLIYIQLTIGGFLWIPNLTEVDASYILPVALGATNLAIIEVQNLIRRRPSSRFQTIATNTFRVLSLAMIPVACSVPSALCLYWLSSSFYGLAQNLFLLSPKVRRLLRIPKTPTELNAPYNHIGDQLRSRFGYKTKSIK